MTDAVAAAIDACLPDLVAIRHDIHRHPELGFEETRTAALVAEALRGFGVEVTEGVARTGVVGTLRGRRPGQRAIGLRADMDALAIAEQTGLPYASAESGKMHACGHDGHTAMLLGAARCLAENPDFAGTVHFIFQPAEEGRGGGKLMVEEGLFDRFACDAVYGLHNKPGLPFGRFSIRSGPMLAASDTWSVTFKGTGGHGGSGPHLAIDPTLPAAQFVLALQGIIGRNVPAIEPAVLSVGHIYGGAFHSPNVIPSEVLVRGTGRSYSPAVRDTLERRLREVATALAAATGAKAVVEYERRYPPLANHAEQVAVAAQAAASVGAPEPVDTNAALVMGAEDFSFMLQQRPGAFMMLGAGGGPGEPFANLHTPLYDFNDKLIGLGVRYWMALVERELRSDA